MLILDCHQKIYLFLKLTNSLSQKSQHVLRPFKKTGIWWWINFNRSAEWVFSSFLKDTKSIIEVKKGYEL